MLVKVTQEDIKNGIHASSYCPVALALKRVFPDKSVRVGISQCFVEDKLYKLPLEVSGKILDYDEDFHIEPFEFEFEL